MTKALQKHLRDFIFVLREVLTDDREIEAAQNACIALSLEEEFE